jgi:hypothetical protein
LANIPRPIFHLGTFLTPFGLQEGQLTSIVKTFTKNQYESFSKFETKLKLEQLSKHY